MMKVIPQRFSRGPSSRRLFVATVSFLTAVSTLPQTQASVTLNVAGGLYTPPVDSPIISGGTLTLNNFANGWSDLEITPTSSPLGATLSRANILSTTDNAVILIPGNIGYPIVANNPPVSNQIDVPNYPGSIDVTGPITSSPAPAPAPLGIATGIKLTTIGTKPSPPKDSGVFTVGTPFVSSAITVGSQQTGTTTTNTNGGTLTLSGGVIKAGTGAIILAPNPGPIVVDPSALQISGGTLTLSSGATTLAGPASPPILSAGTIAISNPVYGGGLTLGSGNLTVTGNNLPVNSSLSIGGGALTLVGGAHLTFGGTSTLITTGVGQGSVITISSGSSIVFPETIPAGSNLARLKNSLEGLTVPPADGTKIVVSMVTFKAVVVPSDTLVADILPTLLDVPGTPDATGTTGIPATPGQNLLTIVNPGSGSPLAINNASNLAAPVPEPSTALLAALGMGLLGLRRRR